MEASVGVVGRLFIDECDLLYFWKGFREKIDELRHMRQIPIPLILMSATVRPGILGFLRSSVRMSESTVIHRESSYKNEVTFFIEKLGRRDDMNSRLLDYLDTPKTIIFCQSKSVCLFLHGFLCGKLEDFTIKVLTSETENQASILREFHLAKNNAVLIGTSALSVGLDIDGVTRVVHFGLTGSISPLVQESGRAGRRGQISQAIFLTCVEYIVEYIEPSTKPLCR